MAGVVGHAVRFERYGGPEVLECVELEFGEPGPGEVLVSIRAAGVNPVDWKIRNGWRSNGRPLDRSTLLGLDAAGTVVATGPGVDGLKVGDEVIGSDLPWAYATHVVTTPDRLVLKPVGLTFEQGSAIGVPVGTAYQVLKTLGLEAGDVLLVHAGAGAVGQAAIQLGRLWGARVVATAGPSNQQRLRDLGAEPLLYGDGLLDRIRASAPDGVDVVIEGAGTVEAIESSLAVVHEPRRIGEIVNREWRDEYGVSAFSASAPGFLSDEDKRLRTEAVPYAAQLAVEGRLRLAIQATFPLAEAADAHRLGEKGHAHGKIVLVPEVVA